MGRMHRRAMAVAGMAALAALVLGGCRPGTHTVVTALPPAHDVVFVVPHEDDESIFAGELLEHYRSSGAHVKLIYGTLSVGGAVAAKLPDYGVARGRGLAEVLARFPGFEVTTAPIPDGGGMPTGRKTREFAEFLRRPGMVPRDAAVFVIGGTGNSDHVDCREDVLSLMARRRQPVFLYWGYGQDHSRLDTDRYGQPVAFVPSETERASKRWASGVYDRGVYRDARFRRFRPRIMDTVGDDVVTAVWPRPPDPRPVAVSDSYRRTKLSSRSSSR